MTEISLLLLKLINLLSDLVYCLTVALDLVLQVILLSLGLVGAHLSLLTDQIVQFLLDLRLLRLHHVHLRVLVVQLDLDTGFLLLVVSSRVEKLGWVQEPLYGVLHLRGPIF